MTSLTNKQQTVSGKNITCVKLDAESSMSSDHLFSLEFKIFQKVIDQMDTEKLELLITYPPIQYIQEENRSIKFLYVLGKLTHAKNYQHLLHRCLEYAVALGNKKLASILFERGGDVSFIDEEGYTFLGVVLSHINYDASDLENKKPREDMFRLLVEKGARLLRLDFKNRNVIQIIHNEELDHLLPILEEYIPFFSEQQKKDWKIIQFSQIFK